MILKPPKGAQLRRGHPLSRGLVGYWLMNEAGGSVVQDLSGNGRTGTFGLSDANYPTWTTGLHGPAVKFVLAQSQGIGFTGPYNDSAAGTIIAYVYPDDVSSDQVIFNGGSGTNRLYVTWGYTPSKFGMRFGEDTLIESSGTYEVGWHCVALTFQKSGPVILYVDGVQAASGTHSAGLIGDGTGYWGYYEGNYYFKGSMSGGCCYNRVLSPSEIARLYRDPYQMVRRDPIELWTAAASGGSAPTTFKPYWIPRRHQTIGAGVI